MKKIILSILTFAVLFTLCGCSFFEENSTIAFKDFPELSYTVSVDSDGKVINAEQSETDFMNSVKIVVNGTTVESLNQLEGAGAVITGLDFNNEGVKNLIIKYEGNILTFEYEVIKETSLVKVGSAYYKTFEEAVEAADGKAVTITLLKDVDFTEKFAANVGSIYNYSEGKYENLFDLTNDVLDLNGHKIISNNYSVQYYADGNGCTIKNGTFECANGGSYGLFLSYSSGQIVLENISTIGGINCYSCSDVVIRNMSSNKTSGTNYYAVWVEGNSHVTIESGYFSSPSTLGGKVFACTDNIGCSITINGGTFEALGTANMFDKGGSEIYVNGGTFNKDPSAFVSLPYETIDNGNETWTVREASCWKVTYSEEGYEAMDHDTFLTMDQAECYYQSTSENKGEYICCSDNTIKVFANGTTASSYYTMVINNPSWYKNNFYRIAVVEKIEYFTSESEAIEFSNNHDGVVTKLN